MQFFYFPQGKRAQKTFMAKAVESEESGFSSPALSSLQFFFKKVTEVYFTPDGKPCREG